MNDDNVFGSAFGKLGQVAKKVGQQAVKIPEEMVKDAAGQIIGKKQTDKPQEKKPQWASDEERIKFLKGLYGSSQPSGEASAGKAKENSSNPQNKPQSDFEKQIADKSPEEQKKLLELRQQLHKQVYYDPTFNPVKKQEERPAEKVEKEKKVEMQELQQKEAKKPPPLAVVREQNKAEMFRGVSG